MPLLNLNDQNNIAQVPSNFQTLDTSRYVVFPYSQAYSYYLSDGKPTTISPSEINLIDTLLIKASEEYNNKKDKYFSWQPISSLERYWIAITKKWFMQIASDLGHFTGGKRHLKISQAIGEQF